MGTEATVSRVPISVSLTGLRKHIAIGKYGFSIATKDGMGTGPKMAVLTPSSVCSVSIRKHSGGTADGSHRFARLEVKFTLTTGLLSISKLTPGKALSDGIGDRKPATTRSRSFGFGTERRISQEIMVRTGV